MDALPIVYLTYMFVSLYFLFLTLILYFKNKKHIFESPKLTKHYSVSFLVPAYNESRTVAETIKHIYDIDYDNITEIIAINDGSTDNTLDVLKELIQKYKGHKTKLKIINKKNSGKADSLNTALKFAEGEIVIVVDADSYPAKDSLNKILGFFDNPEVGCATGVCIARNQNTFLEKLQGLEYRVIAFTRKLLEYIDSIYVIPGPLGVYRKKALLDIGGFDKNNMTEDIEATWHLLNNDWKIRMSLDTHVSTTVPNQFKLWYTQRRRWAMGGLQCLVKYKKRLFRKNMLGFFVVPFFAVGYLLGLLGIVIFLYLFARRAIADWLLVKYSIYVSVPVLTMNDVYITPSILNYFGVLLFLFFFLFNFFVLSVIEDNIGKKQSFFNMLFYMTVYLLVYPFALITAIIHLIKGKKVWR